MTDTVPRSREHQLVIDHGFGGFCTICGVEECDVAKAASDLGNLKEKFAELQTELHETRVAHERSMDSQRAYYRTLLRDKSK